MNISEDIYQYFDGSLQSEQQTKLFAELSINEDKRLLFNNLFSIKKSIFENKSFFTPPVDSVSAIFSTIEYLKISDNKKTSKTTSYYLSNFFQSYKQGIICAVAAAIITAAILIPLFKYDSGKVRFPVQQASFRQTPVDNMEKVSNDMHPPEIHKKIVNPEKSSGSKFHSINEKEIIPEKIQESLKSYNIFPSLFSESYKNIQYFQNIRIENEKLSSLVTNNITHISDNSDKFSLEL
ncbi:MAG: hypothetical protein QG635_2248, partial [Bacteroidota bacterium]|nr:hypothetical protein [Bacteroidota bacterium]